MSVQNTHKHTKTHTADPLSTTSDDDERFDHFLLHLFAGSWVARELENRQRALRRSTSYAITCSYAPPDCPASELVIESYTGVTGLRYWSALEAETETAGSDGPIRELGTPPAIPHWQVLFKFNYNFLSDGVTVRDG